VPKRTNAFQTVIFMIQSHIAGQAKVTESVELTDLVTGEPREVDVCIETQVAGHGIIVSIECRDHARKQDVRWIQEMHAKHERLPTDHLVLVSSSGFTRQALKVARTYNIATIVPEELTEDRAAEIGARVSRVGVGRMELVQVTKVRVVVATIEEPITVPPELGDMPIFIEAGTVVARMRDIVHGIITGYGSTGHILLNPPDNIDGMNLHYDNLRFAIGGQPQYLYLRMPDGNGNLSQLHRITLTADVRHTMSDVPMRHGQPARRLLVGRSDPRRQANTNCRNQG
jgi:hypothetical protein